MSPIAAGLVSGFVIGAVMVVLVFLRREAIVAQMKPEFDKDPTMAKLGERGILALFLGAAGGGSVLFGLPAGWVYSRVEEGVTYLVIAVGLAVLLSVAAWVNRKSGLFLETVVANFVFGIGFGLLVPLLAG